MEKMKMETKNWTSENIEKIGELFPNVITEARGEDGTLKKAINFESLRQVLSEDMLEGDEAFEFTWVGKKASMVEAGKPIRKTLRPSKEESKDWDTTENLYIEGDNLDVLKLLQESYLGQVKMIYIDPPYNTGNDFIYRDNFAKGLKEYEEQEGLFGDEGERLFLNTINNGRFHSDWCSMMFPRLQLARNILSDDGLLFISIDENEQAALRFLCDEVFGEENLINTVAIKMSELSGVKMSSLTKFPKLKEYLLVYSKKKSDKALTIERVSKDKEKLDTYLGYYSNIIENISENCEEWKISKVDDYLKKESINLSEEEKNSWKIENAARLIYRTNSKTIDSYIKKHPNAPQICCFVNEVGKTVYKWDNKEMLFLNNYLDEPLGDIWTDISTINLNKENQGLNFFQNGQKPLKLITRIIKTFPSQDFVCLDFFSGSATTAHAVMQQNAEDGGMRKFIMVQLPEETAPESEAYKAGYKNICEIGKERIRRAGEKIKAEIESSSKQLALGEEPKQVPDIGFRVLKLDESNMKHVYYTPGAYSQTILEGLESNIKEDRTDLDLLFSCLLEWGLPLSMPYTSEQIEGFAVHTYNEGDLIACFDAKISEKAIKEIAKRQPLRVVFRDSSFASSPEKINVEEIFKLLAPNTSVRVL